MVCEGNANKTNRTRVVWKIKGLIVISLFFFALSSCFIPRE